MQDVPPAHTTDVAVCSRPGTPPVAARPIAQVVPAVGGLVLRPAADLVALVPGGAEQLVSEGIAVGHRVVVGFWKLAAPHLGGHAGARFDDQAVGADVIGPR